MSAPHARGCSLVGERGAVQRQVGPARAGVLPGHPMPVASATSRPRTRGGAPNWPVGLSTQSPSAPHARGCSLVEAGSALVLVVGPARAGVLRPARSAASAGSGRPRTRRGAPQRLRYPARAGGRVGPARAGVLPSSGPASASPTSRPRTRGGAPPVSNTTSPALTSAPHARGCSVRTAQRLPRRGVGPARAGVLPPQPGPRRGWRGRPRTRGGAPGKISVSADPKQSAPHARGCSRSCGTARKRSVVGPARAGVLPTRPRGCSFNRSRPRTRGGAPPAELVLALDNRSAPHARGCSDPHHRRRLHRLVGPARAGVLPSRPTRSASRSSRPRTRGGAPPPCAPRSSRSASAPHARGCSLLAFCAVYDQRVGPARAGVLPVAAAAARWAACRPRTRGGAPRSRVAASIACLSAPHARGCSRPGRQPDRLDVVGPARAGVLPSSVLSPAAPPCRPRTRGGAPGVVEIGAGGG